MFINRWVGNKNIVHTEFVFVFVLICKERKIKSIAREKAQCVKVLAARPENLSSNPMTHMLEGK